MSCPIRILIIYETLAQTKPLKAQLEAQGYWVVTRHSQEQDAPSLLKSAFHLIILDVFFVTSAMVEFIRNLHNQAGLASIMVLSEQQTDIHATVLNVGADDYLSKPFVLMELWARVRALTRRVVHHPDPVLVYGELLLDPSQRIAMYGAQRLALSPKECETLAFLMLYPGRTLPRGQLNADAISGLRRKLRQYGQADYIQAVRRRGYRLAWTKKECQSSSSTSD